MSTSLHELSHRAAVSALLDLILHRAAAELSDAVGMSLIARDHCGTFVLAHHGDVERAVIDTQLRSGQGPVSDALAHDVPVISLNVRHDERWPDLGRRFEQVSALAEPAAWQVAGAAAVPATWSGEDTVVLSATLSRPASAATVATLIDYEDVVHASLTAACADVDDAMGIARSRGVIEQAKGAIMGRLGCDAERAFLVLREASQRWNVKLRALAVALVELIAIAPAPPPPMVAPIVADGDARAAARRLWMAVGEIAAEP